MKFVYIMICYHGNTHFAENTGLWLEIHMLKDLVISISSNTYKCYILCAMCIKY